MTFDVLFRSIEGRILAPDRPSCLALLPELQRSDPSEAHILSATSFLETANGDMDRGRLSRAQTPSATLRISQKSPVRYPNPQPHRLPPNFLCREPLMPVSRELPLIPMPKSVIPLSRDSKCSLIVSALLSSC